MKYFIIVGEASGDLHGANLIKAIRKLDVNADFKVWGGDRMENEDVDNLNHIKSRTFMGFVEVLKNILTLRKLFHKVKKDILDFKPDKLIFIDYPGFNLRIAAWAHNKGLQTHYYISPKVWAWNTKRALKIKKIINHMYVILPFEVDFYEKYNYKVEYVGNPLMDAIDAFSPDGQFRSRMFKDSKPIIALLPGSRKQELSSILPEMLKSVKGYKKTHTIAIAVAPDFDQEFYNSFSNMESVYLIEHNTYNLLVNCQLALVTSGTATLETALLKTPQVVCYKTSRINYFLGKLLIKVPFISLVNLIAGKEIVKELIQKELNAQNLNSEIHALLEGPKREQMLKKYDELIKLVGPAGASERVARHILSS
ncbi:MAG: lipid-A-disaccharide synthase [Flavobacteriales bacterium]|nr:lipid-A-disaccharide synthase [Flavobacteriales bacterium]